jgi:ribosomal protein L21
VLSQPPLVATHPIRRTVHIAPPGVNAKLHKEMNLPFAGRRKTKKAADGSPTEAASSETAPQQRSDEVMVASEMHEILNRKAGDKRYGSRRRLPGELPAINEGAIPELTEERPPMHERLFAVVSVGGTQYKLTPGDILTAEHIPGAEVGSVLEIEDVLAVGSQQTTVLGRPVVPGVTVRVAVEEQCQDAKVIVFKKRRRKRYQKTQGHRRLVTRLRVLRVDIQGGKGLQIF